METKGTLHFSLGDNLGILLQNLAYEHLYYKQDIEKAVDSIIGAGCPEKYVKDILEGKLFLDVTQDDMMGIFDEKEIKERGKYDEYHKYDPEYIDNLISSPNDFNKIEQGESLIKNFSFFFTKGLIYEINIEDAEYLFDMPNDWHWKAHTELSPLDIARIYVHNDERMKEIIEQAEVVKCFGTPISNAFNDLMGLRNYVKEGVSITKLYDALYNEKNPYHKYAPTSKPSKLFDKYYPLVKDLEHLLEILSELDDKTIKEWAELHKGSEINPAVEPVLRVIESSVDTPMEQLKKFHHKRRENNSERDIAIPVTWDHNWTAGFIDREGNIYAMDEYESRLAHVEIANALYEKNPNMPVLESNLDWSLDRLGWVRFHEGRVRYSGYNLDIWGHKNLPFAARQKDKLAEYCKLYYPHGVYNEGNGDKHTQITEHDWYAMDNDELEKIFEF